MSDSSEPNLRLMVYAGNGGKTTMPPTYYSVCPKCGVLVEELDGFGVIIHDECGYCSHPDAYGGACRHCGAAV